MENKIGEFWRKTFYREENRYEYKKEILPKKLYKYMNFDSSKDSKIKALKNNEVWLSATKNLNDPYDCLGFYIDTKKLIKNKILRVEQVEFLLNNFALLNKPHRVTCFSEELYNMPMWGNYASCHRGVCLEYDLSSLNEESEFFKLLFPVSYEKERVELTKTFEKMLLDENPNYELLFFSSVIKHESWEYEKEWRYIVAEADEENIENDGCIRKLPIKPSTVYLGYNISKEDKDSILDVYSKTTTKVYQMQMSHEKFFNLDKVELNL